MSIAPDLAFAFEDLQVGQSVALGSYAFTAENIVAFARDFDPQPFHLSDEAAAKTHFGRLSASGWHTVAAWMKLMVARMEQVAIKRMKAGIETPMNGPSPGFVDLKWLKPVRAGDTISYFTEVTAKRESASRPNYGLIESLNWGENQHGERVFEFKGRYFAGRYKKS